VFKLFDRYLIKELIPPFFLGLLITTFVFLMNEILLLSEIFITKGVPFETTLNILIYLIPSIIAFTLPMSVLMGVLGGLSRLSSDSEIMAFKTLGISYKRLLRPIFIFSLVGWLLTSFLTLYLAPRANYKWVQTLSQSVLAKVQLEINPREFNESIPNIIIFIQDISPDKNWQNIFLYLSRNRKEPKVILARKGRLNFYPKKKRAIMELSEGTVHSYPEDDPEKYSITTFKKLDEEINVESLFPSLYKKKRVREKDIKELIQDLSLLRRDLKVKPDNEENKLIIQQTKRNYISHWVEIHKKFALSFACLVFAFLGLPLGAYTRKGGRTSGFTISLAIILIYYVLITAGEKMAMEGQISAWVGMWGPNIILAGVGLYLFTKALQEKALFSWLSFLKNLRMKNPFSFPQKKAAGKGPRLSLRFPNILDRYLLRKYLLIFTLVFLTLLLILIIITFFERIDNVYEHNKPIWMLLEFIRYNIPGFIHYILPVAALTATLLSLGLLTKSNEITAMKACGLSLYRIIIPVILMGIVASFCSFYLQERVLPYANKRAEEVWNKINDVPPRSYGYLDRRWVLNQEKNRIYNYNYFDPERSVFSQLSIYDIDLSSWFLKRRIYSEKGVLEDHQLDLINCWLREFKQGFPLKYKKSSELKLSPVEEKSYFLKEWKEPDQMSYQELRRYTRDVEKMGFATAKFKVALNYKLSFPLASLIMTLLGIPFAFSMGKKGALVGIGLSLAIAAVYWGAIGLFKSLGDVSYLNAFLAAWSPDLIFSLIAIYLIFTLRT